MLAMNTLKTWLQAEYGRQVRLAAHLGIPAPSVAGWLSGRRPVPVVHGAAIEQFTGGAVTRQDLFPTEWRRVWPELAISTQNTAEPSAARSFVAIHTEAQEVANG